MAKNVPIRTGFRGDIELGEQRTNCLDSRMLLNWRKTVQHAWPGCTTHVTFGGRDYGRPIKVE